MRSVLSLSVALAVVAGASLASAQDIASPQVSTQQAAPTGNSGGGGEITSTAGATDHSMVVGHLGLEYMGSTSVSTLPSSIATGMGTGAITFGSASLQTVGVRYWLNNTIGLDVGLSLGVDSGSTSVTGMATQDNPSFFGFGLYGALPIMLAEAKHASIHIDPFLEFAYGSSGITLGSGTDVTSVSLNSIYFALGATAVAELQFGFIGLPQLGLQAKLGIALEYSTASATSTNQSSNTSSTESVNSLAFHTTLGSPNSPAYSLADILTGSVGVVWYFGYTPGSSH